MPQFGASIPIGPPVFDLLRIPTEADPPNPRANRNSVCDGPVRTGKNGGNVSGNLFTGFERRIRNESR
jgi:hypothetical protein